MTRGALWTFFIFPYFWRALLFEYLVLTNDIPVECMKYIQDQENVQFK